MTTDTSVSSDEQVCAVCRKPLVFKGYYSNGCTEFIGEEWDCPDACEEGAESIEDGADCHE